MSDHTRQNLGRTHGHTCSTLVGTPELAQPARALAPASGQVRRAPTPSAVLARAYKASPGAPHFARHSSSPAGHFPSAPASLIPPAIAARASAIVTSPLQPPPSQASASGSSTRWPRTRPDFTGGSRSTSPDFGLPPPRVDRAIQ
jgi:hypothetical protein